MTSSEPRKTFFPSHVYNFPVTQWWGIVFFGPQDFVPYKTNCRFKLHWVARAVSRKWLTLIQSRDVDALAEMSLGDFALAVFDKVAELVVCTRVRDDRTGRMISTGDEWMRQIPLFSLFAHTLVSLPSHSHSPQAMGILKENFDENDLMRFANLSDIQPFLLAAASRIWQKYVDSGCPPPTLRAQGYDAWAGWVDAHVPALESLPPRPFTKVNHDDPDAEPTIVWLDHELKQVPAPKLRPGRLANALKRGTAPPHAPSTTLSPPSSVPSASVASASGFSGSPPSSAPVPLLHPPSPRSAPSSRPSPMATMRHFFSRTRRPRVPSMPPNP